jgi:transposase
MSRSVLGIDISKAKFDVALLLVDGKVKTKKFANNSNGFSELVDWLIKKNVKGLHACMESTGNYGEALSTFLFDRQYTISVVNPAQIKGFSRSELSRTKTDKADAQLIARFCMAMMPKPWKPVPLRKF